jgi:outer membrane protein OmpA-like peptidoglycan-associated protein
LQHAAALIRQTAGPVRIIGHMDTTGDADANQQLSLRRARAVRDYLISACGCDPARFEIDGRGSAEPVETNDTPAGRRANRRVELLIAN